MRFAHRLLRTNARPGSYNWYATIFGFFWGVIGAFIYNLSAKIVGGLRIDLK